MESSSGWLRTAIHEFFCVRFTLEHDDYMFSETDFTQEFFFIQLKELQFLLLLADDLSQNGRKAV